MPDAVLQPAPVSANTRLWRAIHRDSRSSLITAIVSRWIR
jgi:hypothetical protein